MDAAAGSATATVALESLAHATTEEVAVPLDYRLVCRTCLSSDAEFFMMDAPAAFDDSDEDEEKVSFLECLTYCTRLEDVPELPVYICMECSVSLQVAYNFIRNALEAHEILRQKLCDRTGGSGAQKRRNNVALRDPNGKYYPAESADGGRTSPKMRYRCKLCNEKVESKKALKEHVKVHLDIISYCCQFCSFECKKRSQLSEHYITVHNTQPTREQLKPKTSVDIKEESEVEQDDEIYQQMEQIHNAPENLDGQQMQPQQQHEEADKQVYKVEANVQQHGIENSNTIVVESTRDNLNVISTEVQYEELNSIPANELSVGNEFIVMSDGTVEEVMGNGVVIEYINAADDGVTLENGLVLDNVVQVEAASNVHTTVNSMDMDVDDIIIEEVNELMTAAVAAPSERKIATVKETIVQTLENIEDEMPPPSIITLNNLKRLKCKICASNFQTQEHLKTHMLSHNEIPHFFCDQCAFYTFFKIDLTQHYKTKHKLQPTQKQLQPKNKVKSVESTGDLKHLYACDLCLYETNLKAHLRRHYLSQHQEEATEVQLRPTIVDETDLSNQGSMPAAPSSPKRQMKPLRPDYPKGLNCKKCSKTFFWRNKLKDHYKQHSLEEERVMGGMRSAISSTSLLKHNSSVNYVLQNSRSRNNCNPDTAASAPAPDIIMDIPSNTESAAMPQQQHATHSNTALGYACMQIPSDAIPQVVETDTTIDHDLEFVLNDELFEDFDDDVNDDENDEEDSTEFQDLQLTSEDDFEDMLEEQQQRHVMGADNEAAQNVYQPYCVHCNKKFLSQYQFENHMFVHRGVAPYRCEMCTNLYNTKRALIRHYKAVHKKMPTRDMIQAKGDKVAVDRTPVEHLNLAEQKAVTLMCAKCPHESTELQNLHIHLKTVHGLADENYILQKLRFECPRCIRSYATKTRLIRHLERSHSVATIIQQQRSAAMTTRNAIATNSSTSSRCGLKIINNNLPASATISSTTTTLPMPVTTIDDMQREEHTHFLITSTVSTSINNNTKMYKSGGDKNVKTVSQYSCDICHLHWPEESALYIHLVEAHHRSLDTDEVGIVPERLLYDFKCDICGGKYKSLDLLKYHMKRHTARKFSCSSCPKTYINRSELKNHERSHTGETPYHCDLCAKKFRYSHHLKRHRDVAHLGKRYECPVENCMRVFSTQAQLKIHAWNHTGQVPYHCKYCDRTFKKRESLRQHARKLHNCNLTEAEIAEIFRQNLGYTNPHDLIVSASNGAMLRRSDVEAEASQTAKGIAMYKECDQLQQNNAEEQNDDQKYGVDIRTQVASAQLEEEDILENDQIAIDAEVQVNSIEVDNHVVTAHNDNIAMSTYMLHGVVEDNNNLSHFLNNERSDGNF